MILSHDKVSDKTTTNEHYKAWSQENPVRAFTEWPSYAGESLFPTAERNFSTTTATFHPPILNVPPAKSIIRIENKGSLGAFGKKNFSNVLIKKYSCLKNYIKE
jgi:hypothetical protein